MPIRSLAICEAMRAAPTARWLVVNHAVDHNGSFEVVIERPAKTAKQGGLRLYPFEANQRNRLTAHFGQNQPDGFRAN